MTTLQVRAAIQIGVLFILPVLLILVGVIPVPYRFFLLLAVTALVIAIIITEKWTLENIGIRLDNVQRSILWYLLLSVFAVVAIIALDWIFHGKKQDFLDNVHFKFGFLLLSFLQEFLFRSFLIPKLRAISASPVFVIALNGLLFGFLHLIFPNPFSLFVLSSLLGAGFAAVYFFRPNLLLATVAHAVINFIAVFYCFATFASSCT